jgi:hypothetical protein
MCVEGTCGVRTSCLLRPEQHFQSSGEVVRMRARGSGAGRGGTPGSHGSVGPRRLSPVGDGASVSGERPDEVVVSAPSWAGRQWYWLLHRTPPDRRPRRAFN